MNRLRAEGAETERIYDRMGTGEEGEGGFRWQ